jgi:hypothetical protein
MQSTMQKAVVLGLGIAMVTTLILPNRQTVAALGAAERFTTGNVSTVMGTSSGSIG